jgi:hypothetical protein
MSPRRPRPTRSWSPTEAPPIVTIRSASCGQARSTWPSGSLHRRARWASIRADPALRLDQCLEPVGVGGHDLVRARRPRREAHQLVARRDERHHRPPCSRSARGAFIAAASARSDGRQPPRRLDPVRSDARKSAPEGRMWGPSSRPSPITISVAIARHVLLDHDPFRALRASAHPVKMLSASTRLRSRPAQARARGRLARRP